MATRSSVKGFFRTSSVLAFITGMMVFLPLVAAAAFTGWIGNPFANTVWLLTATWAFCNLYPIVSEGSRPKLTLALAFIAASAVVLLCSYGLIYSTTHQVFDPLYFTAPIAVWAWLTIPLVFNAVHAVLSTLRYQQLSTLR